MNLLRDTFFGMDWSFGKHDNDAKAMDPVVSQGKRGRLDGVSQKVAWESRAIP